MTSQSIQTACCVIARFHSNTEPRGEQVRHHSILLHPERSQEGSSYSVTYRPPNLHDRLTPGESRPRFWLNSSDNEKRLPIVSVSWGINGPLSCKLQRRTNVKRSNTSSKKADESHSTLDARMCPLGAGDSNSLVIPIYPQFLSTFINKVIRIRLVSQDFRARELVGAYCHLRQGQACSPSVEKSCLIRNMHSLRLSLTYSSTVNGLPVVKLEENHGGLKRLKKVRYRPMHVTWIDVDHRKGCLTLAGESFQLYLEAPSPQLSVEDFPDGNGEMPSALGEYVRSLDTAPHIKLRFSARVFFWYTQSTELDGDGVLDSNPKEGTSAGQTSWY